MFSRTSLDKLLNKNHCSNVLKHEKVKVIHDLLEQQQVLFLLEI